MVGESIRCPLHHACFDLRTGEAAGAGALNPLTVWQVKHDGERIFVRQKHAQPKPRGYGPVDASGKIVIVGGGAAGRGRDVAAAGISRQHRDAEQRCRTAGGRPNLSKDYHAGSAPEE